MKTIEELKNKIICGDTLEVLKEIPDESIDMVITSPPYWGLRDYGVEGQIGLESTLEEYLEKLLKITAELKRVLKKSGVMFWNHGDCYGGSGMGTWKNPPEKINSKEVYHIPYGSNVPVRKNRKMAKCLMLQNWRLVLRMVDEQGWILRNTIIWHKINHMPSSVRDRFTSSYEPVFMLVKNKKYYFDLDAVRVPHKVCGVTDKRPMGVLREKLYPNSGYNKSDDPHLAQYQIKKKQTHYPQDQAESFGSPRARYWREKEKPYHPAGDPTIHGQRLPPQPNQEGAFHPLGKNPGDVWEIATQPAPPEVRGKFFAMFPEKLVEPMILAGCPKNRIVLDPFLGSGTTAIVAKKLGRNFVGIELNPQYIKIAEARIKAISKSLSL